MTGDCAERGEFTMRFMTRNVFPLFCFFFLMRGVRKTREFRFVTTTTAVQVLCTRSSRILLGFIGRTTVTAAEQWAIVFFLLFNESLINAILIILYNFTYIR